MSMILNYKVLNALESIKIITRIDPSLHFFNRSKNCNFLYLNIAGKQTMGYFFQLKKKCFFLITENQIKKTC